MPSLPCQGYRNSKHHTFYNPEYTPMKNHVFATVLFVFSIHILPPYIHLNNMSTFQSFHLFSAVHSSILQVPALPAISSPSLIRILEFSSAGLSIFHRNIQAILIRLFIIHATGNFYFRYLHFFIYIPILIMLQPILY